MAGEAFALAHAVSVCHALEPDALVCTRPAPWWRQPALMVPAWPDLIPVVVGTFGGMLVGVDRERRKGDGPMRSFAGVRSFSLTGALGSILGILGDHRLIAVGGVLIAGLALLAYARSRTSDPGTTSEIALLLTYVLGLAAVQYTAFASGAFVLLAMLLVAKEKLHKVVTEKLSDMEIHDGLILAAIALVIFPLIPDRPIALLGDMNPYNLWRLLVLLLSLQWLGYAAVRLAGPRRGLLTSGAVAGIVSSTAQFGAMGTRARQNKDSTRLCAAAALLSHATSMGLLVVIGLPISPSGVNAVLPMIAATVFSTLLIVAFMVGRSAAIEPVDRPAGRVLSLPAAFGFVALLTVLTAVISFSAKWLGTLGAGVAAAAASTLDAHAAFATLLSLETTQAIDQSTLRIAFALSLTANVAGKLVVAYSAGGRAFGNRIAAALLLALASMWAFHFIDWGG